MISHYSGWRFTRIWLILLYSTFAHYAIAFLLERPLSDSSRNIASPHKVTLKYRKTRIDAKFRCSSETRTDGDFVSIEDPVVLAATMSVEQCQPEAVSQASLVLKLAMAGSVATLISDMSMHPIDCIKTLQQSNEGVGLSLVQAAHVIYTQLGGVPGFYKGFFSYAVCDATAGALKFSTYEVLKRQAKSMLPSEEQTSVLNGVLFLCAAIAFAASSIIAVPGELLKQQLQMGHYKNIIDAISSIWESYGFEGYFLGYSGVFMRDIPYTALELGMYDLIKSLYMSRQADTSKPLKSTDEIMAAAITGGISGYITTPLDTVKTKMVVDSCDYLGGGFLDTLTATIHEQGFAAVFAGGTARVAWLVPLTAIYLPTYDYLKRRWTSTDTTQ